MPLDSTLERGPSPAYQGVGWPPLPRWRRLPDVLEHRCDRLPGVSGNDSDIAAPFDRYRALVRPEWIDHNGHMNMGFYLVVFDFATDAWFRYLGLGEPHRAAQAVTTFCLEAHVTYHREVRAGDPLRFTTQLLAWDAKRLHYFHEMYHAADGFLAATNELVSLHVSEATRRAAPMAPEILDRLARIQAVHDALPRPAQIGRRMGLHAPPTTR
jgi:acyl-CoA thioester hydrolase